MSSSATEIRGWVKNQYEGRYFDPHTKKPLPINWDKFIKQLVKLQPHASELITTEVLLLRATLSGETSPAQRQHEVALDEWIYGQYHERGFQNNNFKGWAKFTQLLINLKPKEQAAIKARVEKLRKPGSKYSLEDPGQVAAALAAKKRKENQEKQQEQLKKKTEVGGGVPIQHVPAANGTQSAVDAFKNLFPGSLPTPFVNGTASTPTNGFGASYPSPGSAKSNTPKSGPVTAAGLTSSGPLRDSTALKANATPNINKAPTRSNLPNGLSTSAHVKPTKYGHTAAVHGTGNAFTRAPADPLLPALKAEYSTYSNAGSLDHGSKNDRMAEISPALADYLFRDRAAEVPTIDPLAGEIQHAPILSEEVVKTNSVTLQQFGPLGVHVDSGTKLFQNTNVPFATFVCGVQGSGKSHTTACMLENALVPVTSSSYGRLENPLSAMVFSYDDFNGDGESFCVSEAVSLASAHADMPQDFKVQNVTVLVSPSNPAIKAMYEKIPNVTVIEFKLDPRSLTVNTILTLMAVDESSAPPLYLADVTRCLRECNVENGGRFDYDDFKRRLALCDFNPAQRNMLEMRIGILESFLDRTGKAKQPQFRPGELTIMDMSCPFIDPNTACILFRIGLHQYLKSKVPGKMIVLDEAHKYMLRVPAAKELNNELLRTIRLQRHKGVRTIIATQEPTLLTDLIALCDVTVIHRFSSSEWFAALKRHIPMANQDHGSLLEDIEALNPGTALVYSPKGIFGKDAEGNLVKGTGKLMKVRVRNRITADAGQSVMADGNSGS